MLHMLSNDELTSLKSYVFSARKGGLPLLSSLAITIRSPG